MHKSARTCKIDQRLACEVFALPFACLKSVQGAIKLEREFATTPRTAMNDSTLDPKLSKKILASLDQILELELAGVVRYMHYSFMIFGHNRIPIVAWLRE